MKDLYFSSQSHQPFFLLMSINALVSMLLFMLNYKGIVTLNLSSSSFHTYSIIFLIFTPAILALIFTTFSHHSTKSAITQKAYMRVFNRFAIGSIVFIIGVLSSELLYSIGMLILLAGHISAIKILIDIYERSQSTSRDDIFWIFSSMLVGVSSHFFFIAGDTFWFPLESFAIQLAIYLYLFLVTFFVAQRMVPFCVHSMIEKNLYIIKIIILLLVMHLFLKSIQSNLSFITHFILAYLTTKELLRLKLPFPNPNPLLGILHIAICWIPIAFTVGGISNLISLVNGTPFLYLDMHLLMLGFIFTMIIGLATRVTLSHSRNMMQADPWIHLLFILTQIVIIVRILTSLVSAWRWESMTLFDISITIWLITFAGWTMRFFPLLKYLTKINVIL